MNAYKTVICKFFPECPRGDACTFAHGKAELVKVHPCWFFNNGGCANTDEDCPRLHQIVPDLRKPIALQRPCFKFHTTNYCRFGDRCRFDHFELTEKEWACHYPVTPYPGAGYSAPKPRQRRPVAVIQRPLFTEADFPPLPSSNLQQHVVDLQTHVQQALTRDNLTHLLDLVPMYYSRVDAIVNEKGCLEPSMLVGGPLTEEVVNTLYKYDFDALLDHGLIAPKA